MPSLSLPKGGGAVRGIGEKFQTDVATGTGSLSVPIATSPGRGGFDVAVSVDYDSGAGNGVFGVGWRLSVPQIARKTDKGLPRYGAGSEPDVFVLSGAEDLVPVRVADGDGTRLDFDDRTDGGASFRVQRYRPRVEGLFARIERWTNHDSGDVHWRATTGDNVTSIYGREPRARIADPQSDSEMPSRIFSWLLEETRDDRGNIARYHYKAEDGAGVDPGRPSETNRFEQGATGPAQFRATAQRYLKRIEYGNHEPGDDSGFYFELVFDYGEHDAARPLPDEANPWPVRADPFSSYRAGFEARTYRLCRRALMFHRFPDELGPEPYLVRSTDFGYRETPVLSYLETVTHAGYLRDDSGDYSRKELPTLECGYVIPDLHDKLEVVEADSLEGIPAGVSGPSQWADLDGEGLPGVLTATGEAWTYKENLGGGAFGPPRLQNTLPAPAELAGGVGQLTDLAGDGKLDLVRYSPPLSGYFERTPAGDWQPFVALRELPDIDWSDPNLRFVDIDGDGHPDVFITEHEVFVWHRSRAKDGFEPATRIRKPDDERDGPAVVFADGTESIHLADMSGDGLADIVRVRNGDVCYWPNLGYARFGRQITMDGSPRFDAPDQFDPRGLRFADIDGSGTTDLVYLGGREVTLHLNQAGNGFSEPRPIRSLPPTDSIADVAVIDLLGQGTACLVWSSALPGDRRRPLAYVDLMGGKKPHLLDHIDNNLGGETRITYAPSTRYYLADKRDGKPWLTRLPFPVQVIERIEHHDHIAGSKLVTSYRYHHGFFDGHEREFRGFACVETLDAESFTSADELTMPPVLTRTWFHTGAWLERERLERALATEYYGGDPEAPPLLRDTHLPPGLSVREQREAARALSGQTLRQEIYALDDSPVAEHPCTISEQSHQVWLVQRSEAGAAAVFFVHPREALTLHYERNPADPRVQHELTLEVDDFGNVTESAAIAYPRRQPLEPEQAKLWALLTKATYVNQPASEGPYHLGVPIETKAVELTGIDLPPFGLLAPDAVRAASSAAVEIPYEATASGGALERRTIEHQRVLYADDQSARLPLGQIGDRVLPCETRTVAFTPGLLDEVFGDRIDEVILRDEGRYIDEENLWWAPSGRIIYDPTSFFLPIAAVDPFGNESSIRYDEHRLLILETEDALGNRVSAAERDLGAPDEPLRPGGIDYRTLAPRVVSDPNANRTAVESDELGMVVKTAAMGKEGAGEGDTLTAPTVEIAYDLLRYQRTRASARPMPVFVETRIREAHGTQNTRFQRSFAYSDGSGREVMTKVAAEPGPAPIRDPGGELLRNAAGELVVGPVDPRWVGTGRTVFDNKGNPVKQYEPFFSSTSEFEDETDLVESGVTPVLRYDPLGRLVRTDNPDGTHVEVRFDPWEQRSFDENDAIAGTPWLAQRQAGTAADKRAADAALAHRDTPDVLHLDTLGRPFLTVQTDGSRELLTRVELDVEGNTRSVTDARGVVTMRQSFDVLGRSLRTLSADAGEQLVLADATGKPLRSFTARGHVVRHRYDELQRPTHLFVRAPDAGGSEILAERIVYGERHPQARDRNLRGEAHLVFDGAGATRSVAYDFKGNPVGGERQLAREYRQTPDWSVLAALTDSAAIEAAAAPLVEPEIFASSATYDALDRITSSTTPDGTITIPRYNEAALLERLSVHIRGAPTATSFVDNIDYNARGQRVAIEHGNGTACTYTYDDETFRLVRQTLARRAPNQVLQDLEYTYDAVGNIVQITDHVSFGGPTSADGLYEYDSLYQLRRAEGREHPGQQPTHADPIRLRLDHPNDTQALRRYREEYDYDPVGNLLEMRHRPLANGPGAWTRRYGYATDSNRLLATSAPGDPAGQLSAAYSHDAAGNMIVMPHLAPMRWDHANRLKASARQVVNDGTPETTYYTYDATGERVRKVTERSAATGQTPRKKQEQLYVGCEIYREYAGDGTTIELERQTLHVMDDERRVALVETKTADASIPAPVFQPTTRQRYQVSNHLGSASMELSGAAEVIGYEEYFPLGGTAFHAADSAAEVSAKRYRYTGKERDTETGLYRMGARYYAAWLGRWTSADPTGLAGGINLYSYSYNNPIRFLDRTGAQPEEQATETWVGGYFDYYTDEARAARGEDIVAYLWRNFRNEPFAAGNWWNNSATKNRAAWATPLTRLERAVVTRLRNRNTLSYKDYNVDSLSASERSRAHKYFGEGPQALEQFVNYKSRHQIAHNFVLSNKRFRLLLMASGVDLTSLGASTGGGVARSFGPRLVPVATTRSVHGTIRTIQTEGFEAQLTILTEKIPGLTRPQARVLLQEAFKKNSSVVFGGSRVRGNYAAASDLDVGFGSLSKAQADKLIRKGNAVEGGLPLETTKIVPGNQTANIPRIQTPEGFFQRSGVRRGGPRAGQPFYSSGSITAKPDGRIIFVPTNGQQ